MTRPGHKRSPATAIGKLARLYGVEQAYVDGTGTRRRVPDDGLVALLRSLGASVDSERDAAEALRNEVRTRWQRRMEPVVAVWRGEPAGCELRGPAERLQDHRRCRLTCEDGRRYEWSVDLGRCRRTGTATIDGERFLAVRLVLPRSLPVGYHTLAIEGVDGDEALVIVAPKRAYAASDGAWGAFLPTYALYTAESWGIGDVSDVERVIAWLGELGGGLFSTLPLLAAFLGRRPFDPSPYSPASRLFWNEVYVDPRRTPEFARSRRAATLAGSTSFSREVAALRRARQIDYARVMRLKRQVLEVLASEVETTGHARAEAFQRFAAGTRVWRYAAFRAVGERLGKPWPVWPARPRDGHLDETDSRPADRRYHTYAQWIAAEQIAALATGARAVGPGLYLDAPVGVHPHGYDVWAHRELFATDAAAGAPPDALFTQGQHWGFPPPHPDAMRRDHYRYFRDTLHHLAAQAGVVRLDHVMGLHRLYWIPDGYPPTEGTYVHYRPDELYAILTLESHRHRVTIVGENLGTVPAAVNRAMHAHGVRKMYVLPFEIRPDRPRAVRRVPRHAVASLNTHDVPTFAAYFRGLDIDTSERLGWLTHRQGTDERRRRRRLRRVLALAMGANPRVSDLELLRCCLRRLAHSAAGLVLVNLEDLWGETAPQNMPGTGHELPNWRRKARFSFERFRDEPEVVTALREIAHLCRRTRI